MKSLLSTLLLILAARPQDKPAEEAFRTLEEAFEKARTVGVKFQAITRKAPVEKGEVQGTILLKQGGRIRLEFQGKADGPAGGTPGKPPTKTILVSDGTKGYFLASGPPADLRTVKNLNGRWDVAFVRGGFQALLGALGGNLGLRPGEAEKDPRTLLEVTDLRMGAEDGGQKTLTYKLSFPAADGPKGIEVRLWLDPKTGMPTKRTMSHPGAKESGLPAMDVTETYEEVAVDIDIPDGRFSLTLAELAGPRVRDEALDKVGLYPPPLAGWNKLRTGVLEFQSKAGPGLADPAGEQFETLSSLTARFDLLPRDKMKALLKEQKLDGIADPLELAQPGKLKGVEHLILGSVARFQVMAVKPQAQGGVADKGLPRNPLGIDTSRTVLSLDIAVELRLVRAATGETLSQQTGELKRETSPAAWGLRVIGIGGDAKNNVQLDADSRGKILRVALDDALHKMLPDIDRKPGAPGPELVCAQCKTSSPAGTRFCPKCGTPIEPKK